MKAPKFPSYDEAVNRKSKKGKPLMTKEEWKKLEEERKQKEKEICKKSDKNRKRPATIAFRVSEKDREIIFSKIALSGLNRQDYMTDAILNAPIKVVATRNVIDQCRAELKDISEELQQTNRYEDLDEKHRHELVMISQIIEAALEK
ncbi:MAG: plasmid mobilization protein [Catonella sp.]